MAASGKLVDLLESNLRTVTEPSSYQKLRGKLSTIKPNRRAPSIKESPENTRWIDSSESEG
jgi:hypothetical protein